MLTELEKAKTTYKTATATVKKALEGIFGAEAFAAKIQDRVKTFEEANAIFKTLKFKDAYYKNLQTRKPADLSALDKLVIICRVLQQDWKADWSNTNQYKYYPWFSYNKSKSAAGFGFSYSCYGDVISSTLVGSRLCLPTSELAEYFGTQFIELHNEFLLINQ